MTDIINVSYENERPTVSGRELHEMLRIDSNYTTWFKRMCEYGFIENQDYATCFPNLESEKHGGQNKINHQLTLDMAKQICMIQRTDEGRRYREYFLDIERRWNDPYSVMARSLIFARKQLESITTSLREANVQIEAMKPKARFADAVSASGNSILVGNLAKILRQNGVDINQNKLFEWLRCNDYLMSAKGSRYNLPTQRSVERGWFEIKERTILNPDGSIKTTYTPMVTGKGQVHIIDKFIKNKEN